LDLLANLLVYIFFSRWTPENKAKRNPYAYLAFGIGPRSCIGMRFALEEMKIAICAVVQKFRFFPVEETPVRSFT
jgi:cytochrome P450 family 3 subfamily A